MGLNEYRRKRDFTRTAEPRGPAKKTQAKKAAMAARGGKETPARPPGPMLVVQKHDATNLHYDLRLEIDGVLKSWAVPKGPSFDTADKRLAVEVEDHPMEYGSFEGTIPKGQYGGGTVMLWDRGTWAPLGDAAADHRAGAIKFEAMGERLRGRWMLVRTKKGDAARPQWLLFKESDQHAAPGVTADAFTTSVATGRTMDEIAAGSPPKAAKGRGAPAKKGGAGSASASSKKLRTSARADSSIDAASLPGARRAAAPSRLSPQLASPGAPPVGAEWLHEVKFDGYRLLALKKGDEVQLLTRRGHDWTHRLRRIADALRARVSVDAALDGEAVVMDGRGVSDFQALQNALDRGSAPVIYMVFDIPWCDGFDLAACRLEDRKALLASLIGADQQGRLRLSQFGRVAGPDAFAAACAGGLEGIISKRIDAPYEQKRTATWIKARCHRKQSFVIGGFTRPAGSREALGALAVGYHDKHGALVYAGRVGTGFSTATLRSLGGLLNARRIAAPPFAKLPSEPEIRDATWVRPDLVAEVRFSGWTQENVLRHPVFLGVRDDIAARDVVREPDDPAPSPPSSGPPGRRPARPRASRQAPTVRSADAVALTNADRVLFPDSGAGLGITKLRLAQYYEVVAERMLPHVSGRPLALVRCPGGEGTKAFFQKHPMAGMPSSIGSVAIDGDDGPEDHLVISDAAGLRGLVQMSALEIHPWGARADRVERPDRLIFDLDPGPDVRWKEVIGAALLLRDALVQTSLTPFVKTTGGKGLHVVVPIERRYTWAQAKSFCRAVAETFARMAPGRFVAVASKQRRGGRIYVDYLRNARGATAIAPYSTRARPDGPVATPIAWEEVSTDLRPETFTIAAVEARVRRAPDPWEAMAESAGRLPKS